MSKKKKLTKTLAALSAAGCIIGSATPIALNAVELSKYSVVLRKQKEAEKTLNLVTTILILW